MRLHNKLENELKKLRPRWSGERLYQETRRVVIAIWQSIVYNEFLPVILGNDEFRRHFGQRNGDDSNSSSDSSSDSDEGESFQNREKLFDF